MSGKNLYSLRPGIIALSVAMLLLSAVGVFTGLPDHASSPVDTVHVQEEGGSGESTETPVSHRVYLPLVLKGFQRSDDPTPTPTYTPTPTATPTPTPTPTPTSTPTPTPTDTPTLTATPTELDSFLGGIEGIGEHGAMACVEYQGDPEDLEGLTLTANIGQGDNVLDEDVPAESIEGRTCFEMLDIDYAVDELVSLELNATSEDRVLSNNTQVIALGEYEHQRLILPVFAQSDFTEFPLDIIETHGYEEGPEYAWYAKDFCSLECGPEGNYDSIGTPVYMPHTLQVIYMNGGGQSEEHPGYPNNYNIYYRNPYTGHVFQMGHIIPHEMLLNFLGMELSDIQKDDPYVLEDPLDAPILEYNSNFVLSTWGPPQWQYMIPHLHWEGQMPVPDHPDYNPGPMYNEGDLRNCNCLPQDFGPCLPTCANISLERFILNGYIDPDK